jgi:hypothetical protein
MAKPAFKWLIIANAIIGVSALGMAQDGQSRESGIAEVEHALRCKMVSKRRCR